jgi:hypothetical protein
MRVLTVSVYLRNSIDNMSLSTRFKIWSISHHNDKLIVDNEIEMYMNLLDFNIWEENKNVYNEKGEFLYRYCTETNILLIGYEAIWKKGKEFYNSKNYQEIYELIFFCSCIIYDKKEFKILVC